MSDASLLSTGIGCCVRDNTVPPCMHGHAVKVLAYLCPHDGPLPQMGVVVRHNFAIDTTRQ